MKLIALSISCLLLLIFSCREQAKEDIYSTGNRSFDYFEICYESQLYRFRFSVDSNKIFLRPKLLRGFGIEEIKYGLLPDSLMSKINEAVMLLRADKTISFNGPGDFDSGKLAILTVFKGDTIRLLQKVSVDKRLFHVIETLDSYVNNGQHSSFKGLILLQETRMRLTDLPFPPKGNSTSD